MEKSDILPLKRFGYTSSIEESKNNKIVRMRKQLNLFYLLFYYFELGTTKTNYYY